MNKFLLTLGALAFLQTAQAQHWCGTDELRRQMIANDPDYLAREAALEADIRRLIEENATLRDGDLVIQIPVVFHILHQRGTENLTNERIQTQMQNMNRDFRKLSADISQVSPAFQGLAADTRIEFVLPTKDPFGNCTNGINRIQTVQTFIGESPSKMQQWPRDRYLNVWVAKQLSRPGLLGYALLPAGAEGFAEIFDGIMILESTVGTNDAYLGRTLTHEVGHYLNLLHTWGDSNEPGVVCGDDGVEDTPITKGQFSCPLGAAAIDCTPGVEENTQNYMNYSNCPRMFTLGQSERMRAALNTATARRSSLWTQENLNFTGVNPGTEANCGPDADFYAVAGSNLNNPTVPFNQMSCTNTAVRFIDNSSRAAATSWSWTFQDGNPSTSSERNPTVQFSSPGYKRVTLTVSNQYGSSTKSNDFAVLIGESSSAWQTPYQESFENNNSLWPFVDDNHDRNFTSWRRHSGAGFTGNHSVRLNSGERNPFDIINPNNGQDIDDLVTPNLRLSGLPFGTNLSFAFSYTTQTTDLANVTEKLEIFSSTDCGRTWQTRTTISGQNLVTNGAAAGNFNWVVRNVALPQSVLTDNVRFRFRFTSSDFSGDLYLDDISIGVTVGMETLNGAEMLNIFPNPTNDQFNLQVAGMERLSTEVMVQDLRGAVVFRNIFAPQGGNGIELSTRALGLAEGLYLVRVSNELGSSTQKLVVGR